MNEIITTFELAKSLQELSNRSITPVDVTVSSIQGNVIYLTTTPSPDIDTYFCGELEILTGPAAGLRVPIVHSAGNQIVASAVFLGNHKPEAGDTLRLGGGPLDGAKVFMFEPDSVKNAGNYIVTVNTVASRLTLKSLGKRILTLFGFQRETDFEVICEAPMITGSAEDLLTVRSAAFDIKILKEQCEIVIINFRMDERQRISGKGDIESAYAEIQRTGSPNARRGAIIEFSINQT